MSSHLHRRTFLKHGALAVGAVAAAELGVGCGGSSSSEEPDPGEPSPVFFTSDLSVAGLLRIYAQIGASLTGRVAIKLHSGEPLGPNLLPISLIKGLQATIPDSTIVECNVLYPSPRQGTSGHLEVLRVNGFDFCPVDIADAEGDAVLPIPGMQALIASGRGLTPGRHLTEVAVGSHLLDYDSLLVYTHFKGHQMGGFGGSLKNIGIGCASGQVGKLQVHGPDWELGSLFLERMVESGKAITSHFAPRIAFINVLKNISVDCDCDAAGRQPTCPDIGILGSTDILAIDQASVDLVYALPPDQRRDMVERIESRGGLRQLEHMRTLQMGSRRYELVTV
ncbi:MAG: DUF362 domain-containing protein [Anaeromyxobacter sp.]